MVRTLQGDTDLIPGQGIRSHKPCGMHKRKNKDKLSIHL